MANIYALLGKGKTGKHLLQLLEEKQLPFSVFDSSHPPTQANLEGHQVIISFLTGQVFTQYIPMLVQTKIPVVAGSTGVLWPPPLHQQLVEQQTPWIYASNFSLGMNLIRAMIYNLGQARNLFQEYQFAIHEIHHTKKLDAPSGTALKWEEWLGDHAHITSERIGDVVGIHEITLETPFENIFLRHEARDRRIFAQGALWAAEKIIADRQIPWGLNKFEDLAQMLLQKKG